MPADGRVLRRHRFQRATGQVAREDYVHDVRGRERAHGRNRIDDRDGPFDRRLVVDSDLLVELAVEGVDQALARVHAAARQQPVVAPALLVPAKEHAPPPPQDRRDTNPRLGHQALEEPKPRTPRSLSGSSSPSASSSPGTGRTTSCATRIPASTTKGSRKSVFRSTTRISPR